MVFVITLFTPSMVSADILDDILSLATTTRDRAAVARDRAITARDASAVNLQNIQENAQLISGEMQTAIDEAVEDMQRLVAEFQDGRAEFLGASGCSPEICEPFRQNLIMLLQRLEAIIDILLEIGGINGPNPDFQPLINVIQNLPGRALFLLHRVMVEDNHLFDGDLLVRLSESVNHLQVIRDAIAHDLAQQRASQESQNIHTVRGIEPTHLELEVDRCQYWHQYREQIGRASYVLGGLGLATKVVGGILKGVGTTKIGGVVEAAGVVQVQLTTNPVGRMGRVFDNGAAMMFWGAQLVSTKRTYCSQVVIEGNVRDLIRSTRDDLWKSQAQIRFNQDATLAIQLQTLNALAGD